MEIPNSVKYFQKLNEMVKELASEMKGEKMPRLINADKLRKDVLDLPNCYNGFSDTYDKAMIIDLVDEAPTVDAVEVVRCKDCEYYNGEYKYCVNDIFAKPDGYCSYGKRKKDATND